MTQSTREQPWSEGGPSGRIVLLTRNPISEAITAIAGAVGRATVLVEHDEDGRGVEEVESLSLRPGDAVVLCDHDAPDAPRVMRLAMASDASYVAMMASRGRAAGLHADLRDEGAPGLDKLHVPAGLDTGGKSAGEIALSVVAEVVAESHGRRGAPLREG
ncbi:MAG TPA: XdhC family protein [Marmoricola sp.]|nr:XdhC family protein [Marmoricola sp.]